MRPEAGKLVAVFQCRDQDCKRESEMEWWSLMGLVNDVAEFTIQAERAFFAEAK